MVRKNVFEEHGYLLHGDFPESYELILRWLSIGLKIHKIPEILLTWNNVSSRIIINSQKYRPAAYYTIKSIFLAQWLNDNDHPYVWIWGQVIYQEKELNSLKMPVFSLRVILMW
jgi:hypothetical protein